MQSGAVYSLKHDCTASLGLNFTPIFQKSPPHPAQMYRHKGAPIRPSTAYQGAQTLSKYMIWM